MNIDKSPTPITRSQIAPELRGIVEKLPRLPVSSALGRWLLRNAIKLAQRDKAYAGIRLEKRTTNNGVALRIHVPEGEVTGAALLWIHGGGMLIGSAVQDDLFCSETARELGIVVVSTDYRLAPEHPFPGALDDCHAAWTWLQTSAAQLRIDHTRVAVGGESAGGGLAASLAQRIRDVGDVQPAAQWLFCPMLDDGTAANYELDSIRHKIWDNRQNRAGWRAYLGTEPGATDVPDYAVPARHHDVRGLPATWIGAGDIELFYDENKTYAERLMAAGIDCTFDVVAGAPHGFERIARNTQLAQDYLSRSREWLRRNLNGHRPA